MPHPHASTSSSILPSQYDPRKHVGITPERVTNVSSTDYPGHYPDEDHSWDLEKFKEVRGVCDLRGGQCAEFAGFGDPIAGDVLLLVSCVVAK